jgi:hypothetical protein
MILEKMKNYNFSKNGHILHNGKKIVKDLIITFLNSHRLTKIVSQFKPKKNQFIHNVIFLVFFSKIVYSIFKIIYIRKTHY